MVTDSLDALLERAKLQFTEARSDKALFQAIVDGPFKDQLFSTSLDLGIVVLLQVNPKDNMLDRIALSNTEMAQNTLKITDIPFKEIRIPLDNKRNILNKVAKSGKPMHTTDWEYIFTPVLTGESARFNQAAGGIAVSYVYPLKSRNKGAMIFSYYTPVTNIEKRHIDFMRKYSQLADSYL